MGCGEVGVIDSTSFRLYKPTIITTTDRISNIPNSMYTIRLALDVPVTDAPRDARPINIRVRIAVNMPANNNPVATSFDFFINPSPIIA